MEKEDGNREQGKYECSLQCSFPSSPLICFAFEESHGPGMFFLIVVLMLFLTTP
jgi:hypothetical protein